MKNIIISSIVGLFFCTTLFGQVDLRDKFHFGLRAGASLSNVWDTDAEDFVASPKVGFVGGVYATIPLGRILAIQPELLFSQKGFIGEGTAFGVPYKYSRTSNFIDVPVLLQVRPFSFLSISAGPQVSFLINQEDNFTLGNLSGTQHAEFENDNIRENRIGVHLGVDFIIQHFVISVRSGIDLIDNKGDGTSTDPRYKNSSFQLTLGYSF